MSRGTESSLRNPAAKVSDRSPQRDDVPAEAAELLDQVARLLEQGQPQQALDLLARSKQASPWYMNACGVCLLRLGDAERALEVLRGQVMATGIRLRPDVPTVFKTNFATALLQAGNLAGCQSVLREIKDDEHSAVQRLRAAIRRWQAGLTFWQRCRWYFGGTLSVPVLIDFLPGDL